MQQGDGPMHPSAWQWFHPKVAQIQGENIGLRVGDWLAAVRFLSWTEGAHRQGGLSFLGKGAISLGSKTKAARTPPNPFAAPGARPAPRALCTPCQGWK